MVSPERNRSSREVWGRRITYTGVVIGLLGAISWYAGLPLGKEATLGGTALAASGVIFERVPGKKKQ